MIQDQKYSSGVKSVTDDDEDDAGKSSRAIEAGCDDGEVQAVAAVAAEAPVRGEDNEDAPIGSIDDEGRISTNTYPRNLGWTQVWAMIGKNFLSKYRTPLPTFVEIFSPVLMMLILVAAYQLSEITYKDAKQYTTIQFEVPGPWLDLMVTAVEFVDLPGDNESAVDAADQRRQLMQDLLLVDDVLFPQDSSKLDDGGLPFHFMRNLGWSGGVSSFDTEPTDKFVDRRLQVGSDDAFFDDDDSVNGTEPVGDSLYDYLNLARKQIQRLMDNPVVVPTFGQYVTTSRAIGSLIDEDALPRVLSDSSFGRQWGNLLTLGTLHLTPASNPVVTDFWAYLNETYPNVMNATATRVRLHDTEDAGVQFINDNLLERTWALLDFSEWRDEAVEYKIRMNYTTLPNTAEIVNFVNIGLSREYQRYYLSGYMTLQRTLNEFALSRVDSCSDVETDVYSMPMPTAAYSQNAFFQAVGFLLGLTIAMAYLYPTSRTIKSIVEEKETRMKETLMILGVRPWAHWLSWVVSTGVMFFVIAVLVTVTLSNNVLLHSSAAYLFAFIGLFSSATVGFCFVIASFFSRAKLAAIVGPMALFATLLPRFIFFGSNRYEAIGAKRIASLLPCTAFAFGADIIADYEYSEVGVQSWNAGDGEYSFNTSLGFLFFDTLLYMFLGWYLDLVIPRQYGVARPWYFLFLPSYWSSVFCCCFPGREASANHAVRGEEATHDETRGADFEPIANPAMVERVRIDKLVKRYQKKDDIPPAVDHLNLTMYEDELFCLLGHNGAGKTTTISCLTGLYPSTSGDCFIYGKSIVRETNAARQSMGICPQHNVLFDRLTVTEHLRFFQKIKGIRPSKENVKETANDIGLGEYLGTTSSALSGGNKRKLSLAIALCGDPRFLLLDEPTSGMDVHSRRNCWELLRRKRKGRVTLLTTHFMDEAELLSDRIGVMKEGKLQCCGSPIFLKNRFGLGYNLTVVLEEKIEDDEMYEDPKKDLAVRERILAFLQERLPDTLLVRHTVREITFRFPQGSEESFPEVFDSLEANRKALGIGAYGITNSTLEEVFLQLAEKGTNGEESVSPQHDVATLGTDDLNETVAVAPEDLQYMGPLRQVALLFLKRWTIQKRDLKGAFFMIVLPVILCGVVLLVLTLDVVLAGPAIDMSMELYGRPTSGVNGISSVNDVVVGGGASVPANASASFIPDQYQEMESAFKDLYPKSNLSFVQSLETSSELSSFLLATYNDHRHNTRYGAFSIRDEINLTIKIDWDDLESSLDDLQNISLDENGALAFPDDGRFPLVSESIRLNITTATLIELLQTLTPLTNTTLLNVTHFLNQTDTALLAVLQSAVNHSGIAANFEDAFSDFDSNVQAASNETLNATLFGAVLELLDDIAYAAVEVAQSAENSTTRTSFLDALRLTSESLDRGVVRNVLVDVVQAFEDSLIDTNLTVNETEMADLILEVIDGIGVVGGDNSTSTSHTNAIIVAALAFVDGVLAEATRDSNATLSMEEVIDLFSDSDGGVLFVEASGVLLDIDNLTVVIHNLTIEFQGETIVDGETIIVPLETVAVVLGDMFPNGSQEFVFTLEPTASVLHNSSSPHAVAAFNQAYNEFLFKTCSKNQDARLLSVNHPLPLTTQQEIEIQTLLSVLASLFLLIPYCYIPAAFAVFLVKERVSKSKHLQLVSGVNLSAYWVSSYLWDLALWLTLTVMIMLVFLMYGTSSAAVFVGDAESFFCTFLLTFGYGLSALPFAYLLSRMFSNHSSAQIAIMGIFFITGFVAVNAYFIMSTIESTQDIAEAMRPGLRTLPAYNVGEGFIQLSSAYWEREILDSEKYPFDWDVCGRNLFLLYVLSIPYFLWLIMLEYSSDGGSGGALERCLRKFREVYDNARLRWSGVRRDGDVLELEDGLDQANTHEDDDVIAERVRVQANEESLRDTASVLMVNLWKIYPPSVGMFGTCVSFIGGWLRWFCCCLCCRRNGNSDTADEEDDERRSKLPKRAVRGVSTAVMPGETYGLLGVNGAGKTTTLGVLTGDVKPTAGVVTIGGFDVTGNTPGGVQGARQQLGYCPQIDPLLDLMTGRETLRMFGKLRGIPADKLDSTVQAMLDQLTLTPHADKVSESYSGGNKRKLSLGIALIGDPKVLLIDEASSGMDPAARRHTWELIEAVRKQRSVILTTHLMEEAEALCTRVGVMVKGQLLCLGTVQYLKTKYLDGYTIDIQCESGGDEAGVDALVSKVLTSTLPGSSVAERHGRFLRFDMPTLSNLGLGETFRRLRQLREESCVENYSISQCSLEQVFIKLVKGNGGANLRASMVGSESMGAASTDVSDFDVEANGTADLQTADESESMGAASTDVSNFEVEAEKESSTVEKFE